MLVLGATGGSAGGAGAKIYGEIIGFGMSSDAFHITQPSPDGRAARAMRAAIPRMPDLQLEDIGYINAHGTATHRQRCHRDGRDPQSIWRVLPSAWPSAPPRSMHGHTVFGSGLVRSKAVATLLAFVPRCVATDGELH